MAQRRVVTLVCDLCGAEDIVETHRITVDGTSRDAEACDTCWSNIMAAFAGFAATGREPEKKRYKKDELLEWPDTPWKFTNHAMLRMGERRVSPAAVLRVIKEQEIRRPGKHDGEEIWQRGSVKIVVDPTRQIVTTVARTVDAPALAEAV
jgi:hypothetical protein